MIFLIAVVNAQMSQCHTPVKISVTSEVGRLTSQTSLDTDCGTHKAPWILEAQPGQKVKTLQLH